MTEKRLFASIIKDSSATLTPGQFVVRLTGPGEIVDYSGDIVVPGGVSSRSGSIIMLRNHDPEKPTGTFDWRLTGSGPTASIIGTGKIPLGVTETGDETYRLIVAGVLTDFSIGFDPIEKERIPTGFRYTQWRLLECSAVSVGCLPTAVVLQKSKGLPMTSTSASLAMKLSKHAANNRSDCALIAKHETDQARARRAAIKYVPVVPGLQRYAHDAVRRSVAHCNEVARLQAAAARVKRAGES